VSRLIAILVGFLVLVGAGLAHGLWTDRWHQSTQLSDASERFALLPADLGPWKGEEYEQDPDALALTGAVAHYSRSFLDPQTGERVLVILLLGKPARMSVHRPEHCYQAAGYMMNGAPLKVQIRGEGVEAAEFFTASFSREEASGPNQLRIFWSFSSGNRWEGPASPRTRFAREGLLYKLYIIRDGAGSSGPLGSEPGVRLMGLLLPELKRTLLAGS
jgi:Protein of unknown function (DUF3485)